MKSIAHRCNSITAMQNTSDCLMCEFDVCLSHAGIPVVCHNQENRNDPESISFSCFIDSVSPRSLFVDIKACGIGEADQLARAVITAVRNSQKRSLHLRHYCSFNEFCVQYLVNHRNDFEISPASIEIGVISAGIPLHLFNHLRVDFVVLDYSFITEDIVNRLRPIAIYAYTVNSKWGLRSMRSLNIAGCITDL